jgi:hypothetical protein
MGKGKENRRYPLTFAHSPSAVIVQDIPNAIEPRIRRTGWVAGQ